jgi:hypothetical protein
MCRSLRCFSTAGSASRSLCEHVLLSLRSVLRCMFHSAISRLFSLRWEHTVSSLDSLSCCRASAPMMADWASCSFILAISCVRSTVDNVILAGISNFFPTYITVSTGKCLCRKNLQYDGAFQHLRAQAPSETGHYLRNKIVPVEHPAGRKIRMDTDLEVKRPGLVKESKMAATSRGSHRVFGPHGMTGIA